MTKAVFLKAPKKHRCATYMKFVTGAKLLQDAIVIIH